MNVEVDAYIGCRSESLKFSGRCLGLVSSYELGVLLYKYNSPTAMGVFNYKSKPLEDIVAAKSQGLRLLVALSNDKNKELFVSEEIDFVSSWIGADDNLIIGITALNSDGYIIVEEVFDGK